MNLPAFYLYALLSCLSGGAMFFFLFNIRTYAPRKTSVRFFMASMVFAAVFAFSDALFAVQLYGVAKLGDGFCEFIEGIYIQGSIWSAFCWFVFSELEQHSKALKVFRNRILIAIPILLLSVFVLTNSLHHLLFYTVDGVYTRGVAFLYFIAVPAVFIGFSGIRALVRSFSIKHYSGRMRYRSIFVCSAILLGTLALQAVLGSGVPFRTIGAAMMYFLSQDRIMKSNIFIDKLSGVNNRNVMETYLESHFEGAGESFFYILVDIDDFKRINDQFGHNAGDKAIRALADALKYTATGGILVSRYGGDEFAVIGDFGKEDQLKQYLERVKDNLKRNSQKLPFQLEFSAGYVNKTENIASIPDLLEAADEAMYRVKNEKKKRVEEKRL